MASPLNLKGKRFGTLTAIDVYTKDNTGAYKWVCRCDCGNHYIHRASAIINGRAAECQLCRQVKETGDHHAQRNGQVLPA